MAMEVKSNAILSQDYFLEIGHCMMMRKIYQKEISKDYKMQDIKVP
jgi:hypothetical protein